MALRATKVDENPAVGTMPHRTWRRLLIEAVARSSTLPLGFAPASGALTNRARHAMIRRGLLGFDGAPGRSAAAASKG